MKWLVGHESLKMRTKSSPGKDLGVPAAIMVTDALCSHESEREREREYMRMRE